MPVDKLIPRKLNSDIDAKLIDKASMIDALNLYAGDDIDGGGGVLKNVKGNTQVTQGEGDLFGENSRVLGSVTDDKTGIAYFFVYSTQAEFHGVWAYDPEGKLAGDGEAAVRLIFRDAQFNFPSTGFVKGDIVHVNSTTFSVSEKGDEFDKDAIIFFTDNVNEPRKINAYRAYQAGGSEIYSSVYDTADFITACPKTPLEPITFKFDKDVNRKISNFVKTSGFQFAYQHVYKDGFESSVSSYSDVAFPPSIINQGALSYVSHDDYNRCILYIPQPGPEIKAVKIIAKEGETGSFLLIDEIDVSSLYDSSDNYIGVYSFYNDRITKGFSELEINKQFDSIPRKAQAQSVTDNRLMYGNYLDGFDPVNVDCTAQVVYRERPEDFVDFNVESKSFIGVHIDEENTDDSESAKRKSSGFVIDTSSLPDSVSEGTSLLFKVTMTPDRNWHIYNSDNSYHQSKQIGEYDNFPISGEWNTFGNNSSNYELQDDTDSGLNYLKGLTTASGEDVLLVTGANNGIGGGVVLNWKRKFFPGTSAANELSVPARIGTSAANPIILNGGTILFQAGFTTSIEIQSGFAVIAAKTIEELFLGVGYDGLTYKTRLVEDSIVQSTEATLNHSLPVSNHTLIPQSYMGQQGNNTELSRMIMSVIPGSSSTYNNRRNPLGYCVFKQASAKFKLRPVKNNEGFPSTKKAFRLSLSSLTNVKPMTCYKSMLLGEGTGNVSDYPFLNKWGVLDPDVEFFNAEGEEIAFDPDEHFGYYGSGINIEDLHLDAENDINPFAYKGYSSMIGSLRGNNQTTFDLITEDQDVGLACIFDGEGGPGGGISRGGGGNTYDDLRMNHQGSIPICTPFILDSTSIHPNLFQGVTDNAVFDDEEEGYWNTYMCRLHSPMWTGRVSLNLFQSGSITESLFTFANYLAVFGGTDRFCTSLPLLQSPSTSIYNIELTAETDNIKYPVPEENDSNPGSLDPYSVNFNYLHSNVGTTSFISGTYSGDVFRTFKSNANHEFGIVYYDERGRHGYVNYLSNVFVPGLASSDRPSGSEGGPASIALTLNHEPPSWAHSFKIVYGGNSSIDSFIQYSVPNAYVKDYDQDNPPDTANIYVSLNYLQGHPISYVSSFGARSVEGGLNMYKFKEGDKLRIISTGTENDRTYYESGVYEFDIVGLVDVAPPDPGEESSIVLIDADNADSTNSPRTQGQFLILRDNQDANGFSYTAVTGGDINNWKKNCVVEIYSPAKELGEEERFYYETPNTYRVLRAPNNSLYHSPSTVILNKGDAWFRKVAMNLKDDIDTDLIPFNDQEKANPNFKSFFAESFNATDLHRSDFKGFGRVNLINDQAKESRREASVTYSDKSNPESSKPRYTSFDINKLNFKDYDYNKGGIAFLSPTSGYLIVLQSNRTSLIPISKNILSDASGSTSLVSSNVVLGEAIEQPGVGGSDSPESVIERDDKIYYANKGEAKVYLYAKGAGAKDISTNFVGSALSKAVASADGSVRLVGGYDSLKEEYLLTIIGLNALDTNGVTVVPQPTIDDISGAVGPSGVGGGVADAEDGLSVTGFQVFVDTDGDGIIGINEFINQTEFNLDQFPLIPSGEIAVPASFAGISEIADQIVIDPTNSDDYGAVVNTALSVLGIVGEANLPFVLGGAINSFIADTGADIETPEGLTSFLESLSVSSNGVGSATDANGESSFLDTFDPESNYDLIFKLADNGTPGFAVPPKSDGVDGIVTNAELLAVADVLGLAAPEGDALNADLNLDDVIGTADLLLLLSYFGDFLTDADFPDPDADAFNIEDFAS